MREWEYQRWCRIERRDPEDTASVVAYERWYRDQYHDSDRDAWLDEEDPTHD